MHPFGGPLKKGKNWYEKNGFGIGRCVDSDKWMCRDNQTDDDA